MNADAEVVPAVAGVAMLVLALALACARSPLFAMRLGVAHAVMLALAATAHGMTVGRSTLLAVGLLVLAKAVALPWLLPGDARMREDIRPLPALAMGTLLAVLAWAALPPAAGVRAAVVPLALAMLVLGILPAVLGQGAARRLLGLLVAADGAVLATLALPDPRYPLLLELGVLGLLGALLLALRRERGAPRAVP